MAHAVATRSNLCMYTSMVLSRQGEWKHTHTHLLLVLTWLYWLSVFKNEDLLTIDSSQLGLILGFYFYPPPLHTDVTFDGSVWGWWGRCYSSFTLKCICIQKRSHHPLSLHCFQISISLLLEDLLVYSVSTLTLIICLVNRSRDCKKVYHCKVSECIYGTHNGCYSGLSPFCSIPVDGWL